MWCMVLLPACPRRIGGPTPIAAGVRRMLRRCLELVEDGAVEILTDGHHHRIYRGAMAASCSCSCWATTSGSGAILAEIITRRGPLTVRAIAERLDRDLGTDPTVRHYRALEYPHSPPSPARDPQPAAAKGLRLRRSAWCHALPPADRGG